VIETVLDSEELPAAHRYEWWRELLSQSSQPTVVTSVHVDTFKARSRQLSLGPARVSVLSYSPMRVQRTKALIARADPEAYHLTLATRGTRMFSQNGREVVLHAGGMVLNDSSRPFESRPVGEAESIEGIRVDIPRPMLSLPVAKVEQLLGAPLSGDVGVGALLARFLIDLAAESGSCRPKDMARLGVVMTDLITVLVAHHVDAAEAVAPESRGQALMAAILGFIDDHLGDAGLSPAVIAAAHHISVRTLHLLFERQGRTVANVIRHRRLERCRRDLAEPLLAQRPIHAIAARWGFRHPQAFSRAFRTAYGISARDYRRQGTPRAV